MFALMRSRSPLFFRARVSFLSLAVPLCGCAAASPPKINYPPPQIPPVFDHAIAMGHRIGPVSIGMTEADLLKYLGPPKTSTPYPNGRFTQYIWGELTVGVTDGVVSAVTTTDPSYATPQGIHSDSTEIELKVKLPPQRRKHQDEPDFWFYCYADGTIIGVRGADQIYEGKTGTIASIAIGGPDVCAE
jgi:hypothetical protein